MARARIRFRPWFFYYVILPLLPVLVGLIVLLVVRTTRSPMSLFEGPVIGLFAVGLMAGGIAGLHSSSPPPLTSKEVGEMYIAFAVVLIVSATLLAVYLLTTQIREEWYVVCQTGLVIPACIYGWRART